MVSKKTRNTIILIVGVIIAFILFLELYVNGGNSLARDNQKNAESTIMKYENDISNEGIKTLKDCTYKHFKPTFENYYDYTDDMEYKDKIYYKAITNYEEYQIYKNRWNDICNMNQEDFESNFMVITAIENTSMLGLTLSDIFVDDDTLYIDLDKYKSGEEYDKDKTCISIIIPNTSKCSNIEPRDLRKVRETPEYIYGWKNEKTDGLSMITKDEAVEIAKQYAQSLVSSNSLRGKCLQNYTKLYEVNRTKKAPNNYWLIEDGIIERQLLSASYERDAYEVTLVRTDDSVEMDRAYFYVDAYTGKVIGGMEMSD